jgi:membrane-associated protein
MEAITDFLHQLHDSSGLEELIRWGGYTILAGIVFAETGLLAGFFLPGDSLLFVAGFAVGAGALRPPAPLPDNPATGYLLLILVLMVSAFIGNSLGYWIGAKAGVRLFNRPNSRFFKREQLVRTREFYERHGAKTIVLAEFMPFARTFAPVVAGISGLAPRTFMSYNLIGVVIWVVTMTALGFLLGNLEIVRENIDKAIVIVILLSVSPFGFHLLKAWWKRRRSAPAAEPAAE